MSRPVRRDGMSVDDPERIGDVSIEPEAVRFEVGAIRRGRKQMHRDVMGAVGGHRQVEALGEMRHFHEHGDTTAIGHIRFRVGDRFRPDEVRELVQGVKILAGGDGDTALPDDAGVSVYVPT